MSYEIVENTNTNTENAENNGNPNGNDAGNNVTETGNNPDTVVSTVAEGDSLNPSDENPGGEPTPGEGEGNPDDKPTESNEETPEFYWGGEAVEIAVDDEVSAALKEKGLDAMAIAKELYAKDGEFSLSDETKQKLYEAFGKFSVDAYLSGLKAQNEMFILNSQRDAEKMEQANTERFNTVAKEIGGDEGWAKLEAYALETLSDEELAAFNEVMNSGNHYLQTYAVRELESRRHKAQGDDVVSLIPGNAATPAEGGPLSRQDYYAEMAKLSQTYKHDKAGAALAQAALDARRRAGMAKGI